MSNWKKRYTSCNWCHDWQLVSLRHSAKHSQPCSSQKKNGSSDRCLAHASPSVIHEMSCKNVVRGLDQVKKSENFQCTDCVAGKGHRSLFPAKSATRTSQLLGLVDSDVSGALETLSLGSACYFVIFIDDYSKWRFVHTMKQKSETFSCSKTFHKLAERQSG